MRDLIIALVVVFAIGMIIRNVLKKKRARQATPPSSPPAQASHCPKCGTAVGTGSSFCGSCGAPLE